MVGDWVFGCDICQQVCPWNQRFAPPEGDPSLAPRPDVADSNLVEELSLSRESFNHKYKGSPVERPRRRGYLRNVAVALGNRKDRIAVHALTKALKNDPEALVRAHAAWALGQIGGDSAVQALDEAIETEIDKGVINEIEAALGGYNSAL
jgi:epoxyqueuosine reductase